MEWRGCICLFYRWCVLHTPQNNFKPKNKMDWFGGTFQNWRWGIAWKANWINAERITYKPILKFIKNCFLHFASLQNMFFWCWPRWGQFALLCNHGFRPVFTHADATPTVGWHGEVPLCGTFVCSDHIGNLVSIWHIDFQWPWLSLSWYLIPPWHRILNRVWCPARHVLCGSGTGTSMIGERGWSIIEILKWARNKDG